MRAVRRRARQLGSSESELLNAYPSPRTEDLRNAWAYYEGHRKEIDRLVEETVVEDGKGNRRYPDDLILRDAAGFGRAVVTLNRIHFRRLHRDNAHHAGIVLCYLRFRLYRAGPAHSRTSIAPRGHHAGTALGWGQEPSTGEREGGPRRG